MLGGNIVNTNTTFIKPIEGEGSWSGVEDQLLYQLFVVDKQSIIEIQQKFPNKSAVDIEQRCRTNFAGF